MSKTKRFFYHFYRQYKCLSLHFNNECHKVHNITCYAKTRTKWNKTQPYLVVEGESDNIFIALDKNGNIHATIY